MNKAIAVLSAGIKQDKNGNWVSTDLLEDDQFRSAPGGKLRNQAAAYLYKQDRCKIITTGGVGSEQSIKDIPHPKISKILKDELIILGVLGEDIIEENKSEATYSQLWELGKLVLKLKIKNLNIISSNYHLSRIKVMLEYSKDLKELFATNRIKVFSAEQICLKYDKEKWAEKIKEAYESETMKKRIKLEEQGIEDIKNNKYKFQ